MVNRSAAAVLDADGTFSTTNLPHQMFDAFPDDLPPGFDPELDELPASGEWLLQTPVGNGDGPSNRITLRIHMLAGNDNRGSFNLRAELQESAVVITYYVGDPDVRNRIVYEKCRAGC